MAQTGTAAARIAFIGFGEAGQTIARGLAATGVTGIRTYDLLFDDPRDEGNLRHRAEALQVQAARDHAEAVRGADLVFSAVTATSSVEAAQSCLPALTAGQLFFDINSVSPRRKQRTAALIAPSGALYVDVAVMAPVAPYRHKVPLLVSGPGAAHAMPYFTALGMNAALVADGVGQASAIKMFRSIMIKGLEALMLECMVAAGEYGVEDRVLASLQETYPGVDWKSVSGYMIERAVTHGRRRAAEMREVAATVAEVGLDPIMAASTAERQQWLADLDVKRLLQGQTEDRAQLVAAIRRALGKG